MLHKIRKAIGDRDAGYALSGIVELVDWSQLMAPCVSKAFIAGPYHGLDNKYPQAYLDEYCYRFRRSNFSGYGLNRILQAAIQHLLC